MISIWRKATDIWGNCKHIEVPCRHCMKVRRVGRFGPMLANASSHQEADHKQGETNQALPNKQILRLGSDSVA